jgi:hypothetical protein
VAAAFAAIAAGKCCGDRDAIRVMPAATAYAEVKPAAERLAGQVAADPLPMDAKGGCSKKRHETETEPVWP